METTERIVEAYVRYIKGWATIPNIKCDGQKEIDLFAIDPVTDRRYHIETSVSISGGFSALTALPLEEDEYKVRVKQAGARRKLDFFLQHKFSPPSIAAELKRLGCREERYGKVIVSWGWKEGVEDAAYKHGIELWDFRDLMREIAERGRKVKTYFGDDTLRTLSLFVRALDAEARKNKTSHAIS
jgi:hypothetical protein